MNAVCSQFTFLSPAPPSLRLAFGLFILVVGTGSEVGAADNKTVFAAESFDLVEGDILTEDGTKFVRVKDGGKVELKLRDILDPGDFDFLLRFRYPREAAVRGGNTGISFQLGEDKPTRLQTHTAGGWRWLKLGRFKLREFDDRKLILRTEAIPLDIEKLVLYDGANVADPRHPRTLCKFAQDTVRYAGKEVPFSKKGGWNGSVAARRGYVYVTIGGTPPGEPVFHVFDARNPARLATVVPVHVSRGGWQFFYVHIIARGKWLYDGDYGAVDCFDVADPAKPKLVSGNGRDYQWTLGSLEGDYLYIAKLPGLDIADVPRSSQVPTGNVAVQQ